MILLNKSIISYFRIYIMYFYLNEFINYILPAIIKQFIVAEF